MVQKSYFHWQGSYIYEEPCQFHDFLFSSKLFIKNHNNFLQHFFVLCNYLKH